jgi:hypothetical protein
MIAGKLTPEEAMAIQILEQDPNWQKFKQYITRRYLITSDECETARDDQRYHQGRAFELKMIVNVETKAKNILNGT